MAITDTVRRYVEAGREALSPQKAEQLARTLARQGEIRRDQVTGLARDLVRWSRRNRDRLVELIRVEVRKQIKRSGLATKEEVDALKRRIRDLERGAREPAAARSATGKVTSARTRTAKATTGKTTAKTATSKSAASKATTRRPPPRKTSGS